MWVHNTSSDNLDRNKDWAWHYSPQDNLHEVGIVPGPGTDRVYVTDLQPEYATDDLLGGLMNRSPKYGYPVDVTDLELGEAGPGYGAASDWFVIGGIPADRVMPPYIR